MTLQDLHEYQKRTANFIARHPHSIISVDMGLGKTASVLAWLDWHRSRELRHGRGEVRVVIIAPKRVAENNWQQEAGKWQLHELQSKMVIVAGTKAKRAEAMADTERPIKVIGRDNYADYKDIEADILIIDELTSYKSPTSARSKAVQSIRAAIKVGLTGTFLANGAIDIYGQAAAVGIQWPGSPNFYGWRGQWFKDLLQGSGLQFHKWRLRCPLDILLKPIEQDIFTLTAADYLKIQSVTETTHEVDLGAETYKAIEELDAFLATKIDGEMLALEEGAKFSKLQTMCDGFMYLDDEDPTTGEVSRRTIRQRRSAKLEAVADFVADCRDAGEPVLLFYAFIEEAIWLKELLDDRKVKTESVKARGFIQRWEAGEIECLMAHPASAGHGLNLQHGGRIVVWSTLTYNYELFAQGNARLARQGQTRQTQLHYFVAEKTCEEQAVKALSRKQAEQLEFLTITKQ